MKFKWRKWLRIIHRDFGYIFAGMAIIYSLSGIALNHMEEWNPNYVITYEDLKYDAKNLIGMAEGQLVTMVLQDIEKEDSYKNHYYPSSDRIKIFVKNGSVVLDLLSGKGRLELIERRTIFYEVNFLHYNPVRTWTWFSDIFAGALIVLAVTGLFLIKGKKGITGRGAWLTVLGIVIPLIFLLLYV
jgi:hypothetical protein